MPTDPILIPFAARNHDHKRCIRSALDQAAAVCRARGLRLTQVRRRVLELIWQRHAPVKAYDLLDQLQQEKRAAAPPTVYRALAFLLDAGFVHRIESLNAYVGCGDPSEPHGGQFLICRNCQAVAEINDPAITRLLGREARKLGFRADRQTVEIKGLCPSCSAA
ncbi:MAG: Fur family transcriptional regulator [Gammaproteobacteria bacterium]